jgi:pimeloyl-ACP methyl ester carboxylesterase
VHYSAPGVKTRTVDGLEIRFAESEAERDRTILMLNPWPESLYAYESLWAQLARHSHLVAVDLPGFGRSERRDALLSPSAMGEFLIRLVDAWGLESPHIVGPDIGTGAALFAAARHPGRFSSLVVGNGVSAFPLQVTGPLKDLIEAPDLEFLRALDSRVVVGGALDRIEGYELPADVREDYLQSYDGDRFVESAKYVRSYWHDLPILGELLAEIHTPVQLVAGSRDALVPQGNAEYLHARLPNSTLDILDTGHFLWEQGAQEYGTVITDWVTGGYRHVSTRAHTRTR